MRGSSKWRHVVAVGLIAMSSTALLGERTARAGVSGGDTLTLPLPASVADSFYVEVLGRGVYTPKVTDVTVTLTYSVVGQGGDVVVESDFACPATRPDPVLRVVVTGMQGSLSATALVAGTTTDPQTGEDAPFQETVPDEPVVVDVTTDDLQVVRICGESGDSQGPNTSPQAGFEADCADLTCYFTDASTDPDGSITTWEWDFGDGASSTKQNPDRTYTSAGSYQVSLTVTDDRGGTDTATTSVTVYEPLEITTTSMPEGAPGAPYSHSAQATGGEPPYSWSLVSGALPPGLSLGSSGTVEGRPQKPGTYPFTIAVTHPATGRSASRSLSITIAPNGRGIDGTTES